jgi:starvation-inducible outer membrane lipoprotein
VGKIIVSFFSLVKIFALADARTGSSSRIGAKFTKIYGVDYQVQLEIASLASRQHFTPGLGKGVIP